MDQNPQTQLLLGEQPTIGGTPLVDALGIDMDALIDEWRLSKSYVEQYTRDFMYLDTLVDGIPLTHDKDVPYVGDTTLAGLVRSTPRDSLEQLPTFAMVVNGTKNSIPALLCTFFQKKYVFNQDTFGKGLLSTLQIGGEQALTHGYAPFLVATGQMYNDFGATLRLLHHTDTALEPGVSDSNESGYHFVRANLTPGRLKRILKAAKANPNTTWNVAALEELLKTSPRSKEYSIWESPARRNQAGESSSPTYEIVTRYEVGPGATNVTFSPNLTEGPLRVMDSLSKWGYPRVMYLVIDPAALNPFGVSRVRLASPNQNLLNIYYANIASTLLLNSKPPLLKRGRFLKPVNLKQGVVWETLDPNASVEIKNMDNGALEQFVPMQQQFGAQIQNIMGGRTTTATGSGKSGFSKTAPGVKEAADYEDSNTNQITNILENFLRQYALSAIDTFLSEQEDEDDVIVDDETKNAINQLAANKFQPTPEQPVFVPTIGDDNTIHVVWSDFYESIKDWSVEVSVSVSKDELEDKKRADTQDMLTVVAQNAPAIPNAPQKIEELSNALMEDLAPSIAPPSGVMPAPMMMPGAMPGMAPGAPMPPVQ